MASTESECDALIRTLGGAVVSLGRKGKRTPNTQGVPDRLYFVKGQMWWFEVKSANDYLSPAQIVFLMNVWSHGGLAGCGNQRDLCTLLNAPTPRKVLAGQIEKYSTRQKALRSA